MPSHPIILIVVSLWLTTRASCFSVGLPLRRNGLLSSTPAASSSPLWVSPDPTSDSQSSDKPPKRRSRVTDPFGPTETEEEYPELEEVNLEDLPEAHYDPNSHPIPHQPWRRGLTEGCEDPILSPWRIEAEDVIRSAVEKVGGKCLDITWYLTSLVITLDDQWERVNTDRYLKRVDVLGIEAEAPMFRRPNRTENFEISMEEIEKRKEYLPSQVQLDREQNLLSSYAARLDKRPDEMSIYDLPSDVQTMIHKQRELDMRSQEDPRLKNGKEKMAKSSLPKKPPPKEEKPHLHIRQPLVKRKVELVDNDALSVIGSSILTALEEVDSRLSILDRHEIILTSLGRPEILETQSQFDKHRDCDVIVETIDPFDSNRVLEGKLVDRNSMDLIIRINKRLVTVPHNFIKCVRLREEE